MNGRSGSQSSRFNTYVGFTGNWDGSGYISIRSHSLTVIDPVRFRLKWHKETSLICNECFAEALKSGHANQRVGIG